MMIYIFIVSCVNNNLKNNINENEIILEDSIKSSLNFGYRKITITYKHTMAVIDNTVIIKMGNMLDKIYIKGNEEEKYIDIDKDYFNNIYGKLLKINYAEIIDKGISGLDGYSIEMKIENGFDFIIVHLWTPSYDKEKRKTTDIMEILYEIFKKVDYGHLLE